MLLLVFLIRLVKAVQESRELPSVKAQVEQASVAQTVFFGRRPFRLKAADPKAGPRYLASDEPRFANRTPRSTAPPISLGLLLLLRERCHLRARSSRPHKPSSESAGARVAQTAVFAVCGFHSGLTDKAADLRNGGPRDAAYGHFPGGPPSAFR